MRSRMYLVMTSDGCEFLRNRRFQFLTRISVLKLVLDQTGIKSIGEPVDTPAPTGNHMGIQAETPGVSHAKTPT